MDNDAASSLKENNVYPFLSGGVTKCRVVGRGEATILDSVGQIFDVLRTGELGTNKGQAGQVTNGQTNGPGREGAPVVRNSVHQGSSVNKVLNNSSESSDASKKQLQPCQQYDSSSTSSSSEEDEEDPMEGGAMLHRQGAVNSNLRNCDNVQVGSKVEFSGALTVNTILNVVSPTGEANAVTPAAANSVTPGAPNSVTPGAANTVTPAVSPGAANSVTPGASNSVTPGAPYPVTPGAPYPVTPGAPYPITPDAPYPVTPGAPYPVTPGTPYTITPGAVYPVTPVAPYPVTPGAPYTVFRSVVYAGAPGAAKLPPQSKSHLKRNCALVIFAVGAILGIAAAIYFFVKVFTQIQEHVKDVKEFRLGHNL